MRRTTSRYVFYHRSCVTRPSRHLSEYEDGIDRKISDHEDLGRGSTLTWLSLRWCDQQSVSFLLNSGRVRKKNNAVTQSRDVHFLTLRRVGRFALRSTVAISWNIWVYPVRLVVAGGNVKCVLDTALYGDRDGTLVVGSDHGRQALLDMRERDVMKEVGGCENAGTSSVDILKRRNLKTNQDSCLSLSR